MKKFVVKLFLYSTIAIFFFNAIAVLSLYCLKNSSFYKPQFLYHEVNEPKFDYIIIGSSIGLTGLDTQLIDSICNKKGLNLCIDDTSLSSNYLMLQHYYAQNKKVDYCIVAVSSWDLANKNPAISNNDYRFLPFVNRNYVYQYYKGLEKGFFYFSL